MVVGLYFLFQFVLLSVWKKTSQLITELENEFLEKLLYLLIILQFSSEFY